MYEIIVNKQKEKEIIMLLENKIIVEKYEIEQDEKVIEGSIYLGKVQNILPGMQAAFVDIGEGKNTFIHLKDLLPKIDTKNENQEKIEIKEIKKVIKPGMPLLVQVKKNSTSKKGARVSKHISLPGKYIVLMPEVDFVTVSQKIENEEEKERLKKLVENILPKNFGAIIRTSSENKSEEVLKKDILKLLENWENIKKLEQSTKEYPALLYKNEGLIKKLLIDICEKKVDRILVNDKNVYEKVNKILEDVENQAIKVELKENKNLIEECFLTSQYEKIENRKVWLNCGGFITIDKTEALTAIDVNSGKYVGTKELEQTVYTVNKEATKEIAKQLRLRDIGGIIIIDYIDMEKEENKEKIEKLLEEELKKDRSKSQVMGFTKLNLLEMTRKHIQINE